MVQGYIQHLCLQHQIQRLKITAHGYPPLIRKDTGIVIRVVQMLLKAHLQQSDAFQYGPVYKSRIPEA